MRPLFVLLALFLFFPATALAQDGVPAPGEHANAPEPDTGPAAVADAAPETDSVPVADAGSAVAVGEATVVVVEETSPPAADPNPAPIQPPAEPPDSITDAFKDAGFMIEAAKNGWWGPFVGFLVMILIYILDKLVKIKERIGAKAVPWVAAVFGIVGAMAAQLTTGVFWGQALLHGLTAGISAVGLWEMVFKHVLETKEKEEEKGAEA